ncbi:Taurine catabolism dioxygenase [Mycena venus]|uniref:Taurine catabolism dioxygenase n=1 Tax=Mycena venus TaxID=2733690 RepID=A0A8H6XSF1_9AGAR|nr:Taurine catabolism dioxygenase [Mycena venus]
MLPTPAPALGPLKTFPSCDETPAIGTRFPSTVQLSQILSSPNSDELLKDLATLVSHRGVVFFMDQDLDIEKQRELGTRLGELVGKPATSKLHIYPNSYRDSERNDELPPDVVKISSEGGVARTGYSKSARASDGWHSDACYEHIPSDYSILKMHTLPAVCSRRRYVVGKVICEFAHSTVPTFHSGYEAYDKLSPAYQKFIEGLTAVHDARGLREELAKQPNNAFHGPRGAPENTGIQLEATHPVVRTHPVTGFKTLFANKFFTTRIIELTEDESADVLAYLARHVSENHDLQVRFRWSKNDVAIWDNRCTFHTATFDYEGVRKGTRVVSIGEKPYFDPDSKSRRTALGL